MSAYLTHCQLRSVIAARRCRSVPTPGVYSRGNPDGPTIDGKEVERVHRYMPAKRPGVTKDYPLCLNGAFNLRWTEVAEKVTCEACRELMENGKA